MSINEHSKNQRNLEATSHSDLKGSKCRYSNTFGTHMVSHSDLDERLKVDTESTLNLIPPTVNNDLKSPVRDLSSNYTQPSCNAKLATAVGYYGIALLSPLIIQKGSLSVEGANGTFGYNMRDPVPCSRFTRQNYIDLLWTSAAEFPGLIVFTFLVERMRRKTLLCCACIISSILSVLLLLKVHKILNLLILFAARAILVSIFQLNYIMTSEAYPTTMRAVAMGTGTSFLSIGWPHSPLYSTGAGTGKSRSSHVPAWGSTAGCRSDGHFLALRNQRRWHERISHLSKVTACKSDTTEQFWRTFEAERQN
ncbi:synaptic vesicle 2-related protein [Caerostris darwini]|uniref:Synaptic vesicle 2-related protein n=1 Tax=Caerostris darwini TaxID=1538125 RepID=A0AAV4T798_9ARAC|nr:synaptic vesicle 2-related protein [Caerostris darwini]